MIHVMVFTPSRSKKYVCIYGKKQHRFRIIVWKTTSWKAQFYLNRVIKHWIRALHISDWRMALCALMCRFFQSLFYCTNFQMIITLLEHLIEMIIVCNLMCCKLDGQSSVPGRRIGIIYFTHISAYWSHSKGEVAWVWSWLFISVCAKVNACLSSVPWWHGPYM